MIKSCTSSIKLVFKQLRIHQWSKNILILIPAIASHRFNETSVLIHSLIAFVAFSLFASSIYIINDIADLDNDRLHPDKKNRPIASGKISIFSAYFIMIICLIMGILLSLVLGNEFSFILIIYVLFNLLYTFFLKKIIIIDVLLLMIFYVLRLIAGHISNSIPLSPWLLSFSIFLFFSLGFLKRYVDLINVNTENLSLLKGRAYSVEDSKMLMSIGVCSGLISSMVLTLYTGSEQVQQLYSSPLVLVALSPIMFFWICRIWLFAAKGLINSDPVFFAIKDKVSYGVAIMFLSVMFIAKYIEI